MEKTLVNRKERTYIAVKPDGIQRGLIGEIIGRFEKRGLKLIGIKFVVPNKKTLGIQYPDKESWYKPLGERVLANKKSKGIEDTRDPIEIGKSIRESLFRDMVGKPYVGMIWEGPHAVELGRKTVGATNPLTADVGTIRGDYTVESYELSDYLDQPVRNIVHASSSVEEAEEEIKLWFKPEEIIDYDMVLEEVLYGKGWGVCRAFDNPDTNI